MITEQFPGEGSVEILPGVLPRPYQHECVEVLNEARRNGERRALIHMATGLGKTTVIALGLHDFLTEQPEARVLFLCHRVEIIEQAKVVLEEKLAAHDKSFSVFNPDKITVESLGADIVFASFQSMHGRGDNEPWREVFSPHDFDYVVVDESHHASAETYAPTVEYFNPQFLLGVTATPNRRDERDIRALFGPEKFSMSLARGVAEGWLAKPNYKVISHTAPVSSEGIADDIKERLGAMGKEGAKKMVFVNTIAEARSYASEFDDAVAIYSGMHPNERREALRLFREGHFRTIVSVNILNEGVDIPDVDVIVFARSTESEAIFYQQLGRGLRKTHGKDEVLILDYVGNHNRMLMIESLFHTLARVYKKPVAKEDVAIDLDEEFQIVAEVGGAIELDIAEFEFDSDSVNILESLEVRRRAQAEIDNWSVQKSLAEYKKVYDALGGVAPTRAQLQEHLGDARLKLVVRPFKGNTTDLHKAFREQRPDMDRFSHLVTINNLADIFESEVTDKSLYYGRVNYGMIKKAVAELGVATEKAPNHLNKMVDAVQKEDMPKLREYVTQHRKRRSAAALKDHERQEEWFRRRQEGSSPAYGRQPDNWTTVEDIRMMLEGQYRTDEILSLIGRYTLPTVMYETREDVGVGAVYEPSIPSRFVEPLIKKMTE
jgi:superfamily II DNA or RNA helicase